MRLIGRAVALATVVCACTAERSFAQTAPVFDVSGGYSFLRGDSALLIRNFQGWVGSVTAQISPVFGITGELGGNYWSGDFLGRGEDFTFSVHSFMAGRALPSGPPVTSHYLGRCCSVATA